MLQRAAPAAQFFPFGAGPWRCIGAAFALYELRIVLARILQHFIPQPLPGVLIHPELRWLTIAPVEAYRCGCSRPQTRPCAAESSLRW